jgi:tape measure domain-containing protein
MTKRDVNLVITAQDRASKTVQSIADALETLTQAQDTAASSAQGAATLTDKLGASIQKLEAQATALRALDRLTKDLESAGKALATIEAEAQAAGDAQQQYADRSARARADVERLEGALAKLQAKFQQQDAAASGASAAQDKAAAAAAKAQRDYAALEKRLQRAKTVTDEQRAALSRLQSLVASTAAAERRAAQQAEPLVRARERSAAAIAKQQAALKLAQSEQRAAASAEKQAAEAAEESAAALGRVQTAYAGLSDQTETVRAALARSGATLNDLGGEALQASRDVETLTRALKEQQAAEQRRATAQAEARVLATPGGLRNQYADALRDLIAVRQAVKEAEQPTAALAQRLLDAEKAAAKAGAEYRKYGAQVQAAARKQASEQSKAAEASRTAQLQAIAARETAAAATQAAAATASLTGQQTAAASAAARQRAEVDKLVRSLFQGVESAEALNLSLRRVGDGSRTTLDLTQRLRGQILGLTAAFVGFYNALDQVGRIIDSQRQIDAAFSRLNVAFDDGDQDSTAARTAREIRFLREEANRLGVQFGVLSQEYSKFAVASDAAGFANESIRRIFIATAEAGKVNRASTEELGRVFLALTQIINKQKLTAEELNQQLGEVLPGAAALFSEAMGFGAENVNLLFAAMENGLLITEQDMLRFADALTARFGGALPAALETTTSQIDRLGALIFESRLLVAESGFFDGLAEAVEALNRALASDEGRQALRQIGEILGGLISVVTIAARNFEVFGDVLIVVASAKIAKGVVNLLANLRRAGPGSLEAAQAVVALRSAFEAMSAGATGAGRAVGRFGVALLGFQRASFVIIRSIRAIVASLGGLAGIAGAVVVGTILDAFAGAAAKSAEAAAELEKTEATLLRVKDAFAEAKSAAEAFDLVQKRVTQKEVAEAAARAESIQREVVARGTSGSGVGLRRAEGVSRRDFNTARQQLLQLQDALTRGEINAAQFQSKLRDVASTEIFTAETVTDLQDYAARAVEAEARTTELGAALAFVEGRATEAQRAMFRFGEDAGIQAKRATRDVKAFTEALDKIAGRVPEFNEQRQREAALAEIDAAEQTALRNAPNFAESEFIRRAAEQARFNVVNEKALELDKERAERAREYAQEVEERGRQIEDEIRLLGIVDAREQAIARARLERQREAEAEQQPISADDLDRAGDLAARLFDAQAAVDAARQLEQTAERQREFVEGLEAANQQRDFEIDLTRRTAREQQILRAQREATVSAARVGLEVDQQQLDAIAEREGRLFDLSNVETELNGLYEQRGLLQDQIEAARESGDTRQEERLKEQLDAVNRSLDEALDGAVAFYRAMGGVEAQNAILRLQGLRAEIRGAASEARAFSAAMDTIAAQVPALEAQRNLAAGLAEIDAAEREALARAQNAADAEFIRRNAEQARFNLANAEAIEDEKRRAEAVRDYAEGVAESNRQVEDEIRLLGIVDEREQAIARARLDRQREAESAGTVASAEELQQAADLAAQLFDAEAALSSARDGGGGASEQAEFADELRRANDERRFEIELAGQSARAQQILRAQREATNAAAQAGAVLSRAQLDEIADLEGRLFDLANAEAEVNQLLERRRLLQEQIKFAREGGDTATEERLKQQLDAVNGSLQAAIQSAIQFYQAVGGPEAENAILRLQNLEAEIASVGDQAGVTRGDLEKAFAGSLTNAFDQLAQAIGEGENAIESIGRAFQNFASDFLRRVGEMLVEAAALQLAMRAIGFIGGLFGGGGPGVGGGNIAGLPLGGGFVPVAHTGGVIGSTPLPTRFAPSAWFANAQRYHSGGMPGLRSDEVPAILQTGEEVLSRDDPRNAMNGGGGQNVRIVNAFDAPSFLEQSLSSRPGERVILNFLRANSGAVKSAIGVS